MTIEQMKDKIRTNINAITDVALKAKIEQTVLNNKKAKKNDVQIAYDVVEQAITTSATPVSDSVSPVAENSAKVEVEIDTMLPPTFEYDNKTFTRVHVANMAEFVTIAQSDNLEMVVAEYITRADIKRDNLTRDGLLPIFDGKKERQSYPHNIDIAIPFYVDDNGKIAYVVSVYNAICHDIRPADFDDMYNNYEFAVYTAPAQA